MTLHVRRYLCITLLAVSVPTLVACHPPVTIVTPAGKTAYTQDQIVVRINELENVAIQAAGSASLPLPIAKRIVQFTVGADQTIKASKAGWQAAVATAWKELKEYLPPTSNPAVATAIAAVDIVLASLGGN